MREVHVLNVGQGDCTIIKSGKNEHVTMFDICGGNYTPKKEAFLEALGKAIAVKGNFRMCERPNNPLVFLKEKND